ncbi:hypothetical protein ACOSP7_007518 [Xanthoceras sorbifolium]
MASTAEISAAGAHTVELSDLMNTGASSSQVPEDEDHNLLGDEERYHRICVPLHRAALEGDWRGAERLLSGDAALMLRMPITKELETALHIATGARQIGFAREIIQLMEPRDLSLRDRKGNTAFCIAAAIGSVEIATAILEKYQRVATIKGGDDKTPLYMAVLFGQKEMAILLYARTITCLGAHDRRELFFKSIQTDLYGIALKLLHGYPELALSRDYNHETALHLLAGKPSSQFIQGTKFTRRGELTLTPALQLLRNLWVLILQRQGMDFETILRFPSNLLFKAAKLGNYPFLDELIRPYPSLVHELDENGRTFFHVAILHRQTSVFNLIHKIGFHKEMLATYVDRDNDNMLHLAAKYPDPPPANSLSSAALEMQRELIIFEEVGKLMQPSLREAKNACGQTPQELFAMEHRRLVQSGAKWMKNIASSCMVVATLIATVVFAAAFTVPGGNDDKTGAPTLLKKTCFLLFAISDAIALSSSSFSILMFLSIIISGFTQTDFHRSLPLKLMIGLLALLTSMISMMVTFNSAFFLVYHDKSNFVPIFTLIFVSVPITLFVMLQYPLLRDIFLLTRRSGFLHISFDIWFRSSLCFMLAK